MSPEIQIKEYIDSLEEPKRSEMHALHSLIQSWLPNQKLWFESGLDANNKVVSNPNIGYGEYTIKYANGSSRQFFKFGLSANTAGISIYIMGMQDKEFLSNNYTASIGKAKITGYCIKFKTLKNINLQTLETAIKESLAKV